MVPLIPCKNMDIPKMHSVRKKTAHSRAAKVYILKWSFFGRFGTSSSSPGKWTFWIALRGSLAALQFSLCLKVHILNWLYLQCSGSSLFPGEWCTFRSMTFSFFFFFSLSHTPSTCQTCTTLVFSHSRTALLVSSKRSYLARRTRSRHTANMVAKRC